MKWPNRLTILRMLLVIPFVIVLSLSISINGDYSYAMINQKTILFTIAGTLFFVAMITDYIDGFLAKKYQMISSFGKIFDPIADKIITSSALIILTFAGIIPFYLTIIFILRDVLVDGFRNFAAIKKIKIEVSYLAKLKTLLMSIAIFFIFVIYPIKTSYTSSDILLINIPLILSAVLSLASGCKYFKIVASSFFQK